MKRLPRVNISCRQKGAVQSGGISKRDTGNFSLAEHHETFLTFFRELCLVFTDWCCLLVILRKKTTLLRVTKLINSTEVINQIERELPVHIRHEDE